MTVSELIEKLKTFKQDLLVLVDGYEGGLDDLRVVDDVHGLGMIVDVVLDANWDNEKQCKIRSWDGRHDFVWADRDNGVTCIRIGR